MVTDVVYACLCTDKAVKKGIDSRMISYYKYMRDPCTTCDGTGLSFRIMPDSATSPSPEIAMSESLEGCQFSSTEAISTHCYNVSVSN